MRRNRKGNKKKNGNNGFQNSNARDVQVVRFTPSVFGFPDRLVTKLRYADYYNLTSTAGALAKQVIRWNSTFDPDQTGTGHQPLYRDTYAAIYDHYAVISAKAIIRVVNPGTISMICGVLTDDDTSTSSTFQTLMEQSHGHSVELTPLTGSKSDHVFTVSWNASQILGLDPFASEEYKTAVGSNPTEESELLFWSIPVDGSSTNTLGVTIELQQEVLWTELATPTTS